MKDSSPLLEHLNSEQRAAVEPARGVLLVRAGAGSGKTRVITTRIAHLIAEHQILPSSIIALTFTNKAAAEMKERVNRLLTTTPLKNDFLGETPYVGTFHAYCLRLLKKNRHLMAIPDFTILDSGDQEKLVQKILSEAGLHKQLSAGRVLGAISQAKNRAVDGTVNLLDIDHPTIRDLFLSYESEKERSHSLDFDDLLLSTILLFRKNSEFRSTHQRFIRHILVDEYQDTNRVQHALLKTLACDEEGNNILDSLCVVGDEDQSIYSWRGATVGNILEFGEDFPGTQSVTIAQNYRSVQPILTAANHVINNNHTRVPKELWSTRKADDRIRVIKAASDRQEGDLIARVISTSRSTKKNETCAVLYRSHYQSRTIEEALLAASIPYTIIGGIEFYERQEIKDLIAYLKLAVNPYDRISFMRVFNTPNRGLGDRFAELFFETWDREPLLTFDGIAKLLIDQGFITGSKQKSLLDFLKITSSIQSSSNPAQALQKIIGETNYRAYLHHMFDREIALEKEANVTELLNALLEMEERGITSIAMLLDEIALIQGKSEKNNDNQNHLLLMTLHAAKGLEFDIVVLPGLEEGIFPNGRASIDITSLEEERRLLYVGITRARERLVIFHAAKRYTFGQVSLQFPSRFIDEIPENLAPREDASTWTYSQSSHYFQSWLLGKKVSSEYETWRPPHLNTSSSPKLSAYKWDNDPFGQKSSTPKKNLFENNLRLRNEVDTLSSTDSVWHVGQEVIHAIFGSGIIKAVEQKNSGLVYLTIKFSDSEKKINASFIKPS